MADLNMLAVTGGRERSETEWRVLASGGFQLHRILPLRGRTASVVEAAL